MNIREKLLEELETVDGEALTPHFERGALVFVGPQLDIVDVGVAFAGDNKDSVAHWLQSGDLWKATDKDKDKDNGQLNASNSFQFLILQPFVLAKPVETQ